MKRIPRVKSVYPEADYRLRLLFTNGEERIYDVRPLLGQGRVFRELKDRSAFRSVHPWHGTVQWAGGQDICPDTLYEDSVPVRRRMAVREKGRVKSGRTPTTSWSGNKDRMCAGRTS